MKLLTAPPPAVRDALAGQGAPADTLDLCVSTDINLLGQYDPQWVAVRGRRLWVLDQAAPDPPVLDLQLDPAAQVRGVPVVGSCRLQVRVDGVWLDVCRYSNRLKYTFNRLSKRLEQVARGEPIHLTEEDEHDPCRCRQCGLMLEFPGETCPRCINRGAVVVRMFRLMAPYWRLAGLMLLLLLGGIGLDMVSPLLTRFLIDDVLKVGDPDAVRTLPLLGTALPALSMLLVVVGALALVQSSRALINMCNGRLASKVGTSITFDIRGRLVDHLEKLGLSYYDKQQIGSLVGRVAYDTEAVQGFMSQITGGFVLQSLLVLFSAVMMFSLEPRLAVWTLAPAPLVIAGTAVFYKFVHPRYRRFWDRSSRQAGMLNGILSGIRVVKAFAQEDQELARYQRSSAALRDARRLVDTSAATFYPMMGLVFQVGGWLVWYAGGSQVLAGHITLGTLMAFFGYLWMFYGPLSQLSHLTTWLTQFTTQVHRIFEVLDTPISIAEPARPVTLAQVNGRIELRHVAFGYSRQNPILKDVCLSIAPGQKVGIVGKSGSGKTTIVNLILRFYDVDEGQVLIDGVDVRHISRADLRSATGVVLQEPFLFRGTIWDNLVYGRTVEGSAQVQPDAALIEKVLAASKAANCHDFVMRQMHGYDTWVGERGAGLSGGERQRLSIARAILCEPRILILDEATSSIDSESELLIQQGLAELTRDRTSIIIAHRLSTLRNCDNIFVMEEGRVVESGTHAQLMQLAGRYARLVRIQTSVSKQSTVDDLIQQELRKDQAAEQAPAIARDPDTGLPPPGSPVLRWLEPRIANIHLGHHGALHVTVLNERIYTGVFALRLMPVRFPRRYISLRWIDAEDREQEIGLIRDLSDWPAAAQQLVREALLRRYFVHTITAIRAVRQVHNYLDFEVDTDLGPMEFIMRYSSSAAHDYGRTGKILLDVEDNRYLIPDLSALHPAERAMFERYIYW